MHKDGGDPSTFWTAVIGLVGCILIFVIVVAVQAVFYNQERDEQYRKTILPQLGEVAGLKAGQQEKLHSYAWKNRDEGTVVIPIERAMDLIVQEHRGQGQ